MGDLVFRENVEGFNKMPYFYCTEKMELTTDSQILEKAS